MRRLVLASILLGLTTCGPGETPYLHIVNWLPILHPRGSTEVILPVAGEMVPELGFGWSRGPLTRGNQQLYRVRSSEAEFVFNAVIDEDTPLIIEFQPVATRATATLGVLLNGTPIANMPLKAGWQRRRLQLPGSNLRVGLNTVRLRFKSGTQPRAEPRSGRRPLTALVRHLQILSPLARPQRPDSAEGFLESVADGEARTTDSGTVNQSTSAAGGAPPDLSLSTDSVMNIALELPERARLRAGLRARLIAPEGLAAAALLEPRLTASVELIEADGGHRTLQRLVFDQDLVGVYDVAQELDVSLERWAGQQVLLRLRVWGNTNGRVLWGDLRVTCRCSERLPAGRRADLRVPPASGRLGRPDIFVILLDAARADAFSTYGSDTPTPTVDSLAADGTLFARALSASSWTGPSVPSLLTGRYPEAHGIQVWNRRLAGDIPTLAELLAEAGYYTSLWSHHLMYRSNRSLRRGFENTHLISHHERHELPNATDLFDANRPTFALLHMLLPHAPYDPPAPHRGADTADAGFDVDVTPKALNLYTLLAGPQFDPQLLRYIRGRYQETVRYTDEQVGHILGLLQEHERFDDALVLLLSDHGEGFFEHRQFLHARLIYDEVLRVPLIIKWPRDIDSHPQKIDDPVSLIDIAPTLIDGLGLGESGTRFQGISLLPLIFDGVSADRGLYAVTRGTLRSNEAPRMLMAWERDGLKVVFDESHGAVELFDLAADPGEHVDLATERPLTAQILLQELLSRHHRNRQVFGRHDAEAFRLDPSTVRELRAIGYIE